MAIKILYIGHSSLDLGKSVGLLVFWGTTRGKAPVSINYVSIYLST